ncbi:MAG: transcriptional repressor LexA [Ignavibacteriae bacterium]|nr:transcriptional repressor LexA [Ignavibacteriota bacterium]MCB9210080.1 transcriptional repressor LexA [Ignavibacteriales bacterium]MCB9218535.1 transcriptional repressor LexA [Ignavibacteriales bacterium]
MSLEVNLTDRQKDILNFINDFLTVNGFPPTYREIGNFFSINSTFGVKRHLDALIKKGYINIDSKSNRSITLTEKSLERFNSKKDNNSVEIPILGRVAAGYPVLSEQNIDGTLFIDSSLIKQGGKYFGLKVRGDSMIDDGIFEGDTVIVKSQNEAKNNEIVIAMVNHDTTVKRFRRADNIIELIPANKNYDIISISSKDDLTILGKVVGVYRTYN